MNSIKNLIGFLTTLWGLLAVATAAFPGAAGLLEIPIAAEHSKISPLYPVIGTIASAFCLLLLISFRRELHSLLLARRIALISAGVGFLLFLSFVTMKTVFLDIQVSDNTTPPNSGPYKVTHRSLGLLKVYHYIDGNEVRIEERGDPLDVIALALFAGTFASFTLGFAALGIHTYENSAGNN